MKVMEKEQVKGCLIVRRQISGHETHKDKEEGMVTVKVCYKSDGRSAKGCKVSLGFDGWSRGVTNSEYTDSDGEAHFDADSGSGEVYVDGTTKYKGKLAGRVVVYI
jgi:hypothetical protein